MQKNNQKTAFFENSVRPLLLKHCIGCHGSKKQFAELRLDSLAGMLKGGESGPAIVVNHPEESLLVESIRRESFEMPPDEDLSEDDINILSEWIKSGAMWPDSASLQGEEKHVDFSKHWAFIPVQNPKIPEVLDNSWPQNAIDYFILSRLEAEKLKPSSHASAKALLRRMTMDLTGLQIEYEQTRQYLAMSDPDKISLQIDQLLASPHYGERWGRYWLDLARYADTKGYVFFEKENFRVAYTYRDYVISSFNEDKPYNQFVREQIAADQFLSDIPNESLAALGFITVGPHMKNDINDIIADRIDVVTRGLLGLTVGCARCHDHKYDPISTEDYYSLYGVFRNSVAPLHLPFRSGDNISDEHREAADKVRQAAVALESHYLKKFQDVMQDAQVRLGEYLSVAQANRSGPDTVLFDVIVDGDDLNPQVLQLWQQYLSSTQEQESTVFLPWHRLAKLSMEQFSDQSKKLLQHLLTDKKNSANPFITSYLIGQDLKSFNDVVNAYVTLINQMRQQRLSLQSEGQAGESNPLTDIHKEEYYQAFYNSSSPLMSPFHGFSMLKLFPDRKSQKVVNQLNNALDQARAKLPVELAQMLVLEDTPDLIEPRVMRRGSPGKLAQYVSRRYLRFFKSVSNEPFQNGSGRMELADAIISPANPLTARVIVNRVWQHHFGQGIVATPSDFGIQGSLPSHPELLDHLTIWFVDHNWSIKSLHRYIMQSATYQQASSSNENNEQVDPDNLLCWRMNRRRLDFESMRDGLLMVTDRLDLTVGGKSVPEAMSESNKRRTLYTFINRQKLPGVYRTFDFPPPDVSSGTRNNTTVPGQALFMLNHPLVLSCSKEIGDTAKAKPDNTSGIRYLFQTILQREPTRQELNEMSAYLKKSNQIIDHPDKVPNSWSYGVGAYGLENNLLSNFQKLPHWTGDQFQGGAQLPDKKIGWVFLNSSGGHPGNNMEHVVVIRWTAPEELTISLKGTLKHEKEPGNGIRARVLIAGKKNLGPWVLHQNEVKTNIEKISLQKGESIDFVVDVNDQLGFDSFIWSIDLEEVLTMQAEVSAEKNNRSARRWNYSRDFRNVSPIQMTPWQSLAQILLISNEFQFVD